MSARRNALLFFALAVVWGSAFVAITAGLEYFPPVLFAALRYDVAGIVMLAYAYFATEQPLPRGRDQWRVVAVAAVFLIAAYHALLFVGQQHTTSATAAIVVSLSPVLTTGFARLILPQERLTPIGLAGLGLGVVGVALIARPDPDALLAPDAVGVPLIAGAAAAFALGSVLTRRAETGLPTITMEAWAMVVGAAIMHAGSLAMPGESIADVSLTAEALLAIGYLSLVASAAGFMLYFALLDRLGPIEVNLVSYVAPIVAAVVGWLLLGETVDAVAIVGFGTIAVGFALVKRRAIAAELAALRA
ncbi:EamA family transporter [Salinarchaeum chitinilyticum]